MTGGASVADERSIRAPGRMHLLVVTWQLQSYGGLETRLATLVRAASARGWDLTLVSARPLPTSGPVSGLALDGARCIELQDQWRSTITGRLAVGAGQLRETIRTRRPVVRADPGRHGHRSFRRYWSEFWAHDGAELMQHADAVHLVGMPKEFLARTLRAAGSTGVPAAYQAVHQVDERYAERAHFRAFFDEIHRCAVIFTSHQGQADDFRRHLEYRNRCITVPQWCYEDEAELLALEPLDHFAGSVRLGSLARLDEVKRLDVAIEAVALAAAGGVDCRLVIGGSGPAESDLRVLTDRLGVADRVEFVGKVSDRADWYGGIDVFVLCSSAEGGPITGVEAMAAGRAIITTPVGAMPERVSDGADAVVVPIGDAESLAAQISRLAGDSELRVALGRAARSTYLERFSASLHASTMIDELAALATGPPAGPSGDAASPLSS